MQHKSLQSSHSSSVRTPRIPENHINAAIDFIAGNEGMNMSSFPAAFKKASGLSWSYAEWRFRNFTDSINALSEHVYIADREGQARIFCHPKAFRERKKEKALIPLQEPKLENENYSDAFDPLPSDRSYYSEWNCQAEGSQPICLEQLMLPPTELSSVVCANQACRLVVSRESWLFPCGHLCCRFCCTSFVDRNARLVSCPRCRTRWRYRKSCTEILIYIHTNRNKEAALELAQVIEDFPCRCIQHCCLWRGTISSWRKHHPVCPSIVKAAAHPIYDKDLTDLDPVDLPFLKLKQYYKHTGHVPEISEESRSYNGLLNKQIEVAIRQLHEHQHIRPRKLTPQRLCKNERRSPDVRSCSESTSSSEFNRRSLEKRSSRRLSSRRTHRRA